MALAWLTPDSSQLAESLRERYISIPGSLFNYVTGALEELTRPERWEQFGDATPEESADFFLGVWENYLMSEFKMVGTIVGFAVQGSVPAFWYVMNGQSLVADDYPELAAAVPTIWLSGGNIVLPDMRGGFGLVQAGNQSGYPNKAIGTTGGEHDHVLTVSEMPNHSHNYNEPQSVVLRSSGSQPANSGTSFSPTATAGSDQPHNNMPPYLAVRFAIYAGR